MATEHKSSPEIDRGVFEVSTEKFTEITCDRPPGDIQLLDLKASAPDLFAGTDKIPRLLEKVWRRACDEVMSESKGMYCHKAGSVVQMYFFDMTATVGKAKAGLVSAKIPKILDAARNGDGIFSAPLPQPVKQQPPPDKPSEVSRLVKEGMPDNPSLDLVRFWTQRVVHEVAASKQKIPLTHEMVDLAAKSGSFFLPVWSPAGQAIVGSAAGVHSPLPHQQWDTGEGARLDVIALISAVFQLCSLHNKGQSALMILPLRTASLLDEDLTEFFAALLRRLPPEAGRSVILCIRDLPRDGAPARLLSAIDVLAPFVRAYTFETGLLSFPDFSQKFPKTFAVGFDSEDVGLNEHEQGVHIPKYAAHYRKAGLKTYVTSVTSPHVFDAAVKDGFTYISGPLVRPRQKTAFTVEKLPVGGIRKT